MFTVYLLNVLFPLYVRSRDGFRVRLSLSTFRPVTLIKRNERGDKKKLSHDPVAPSPLEVSA